MSTRKKYKKLWPCIILEWVVIPFRRGSSQPRDRIQVSCIAGSNPGLLHYRIESRSPALQDQIQVSCITGRFFAI